MKSVSPEMLALESIGSLTRLQPYLKQLGFKID